MQGAKLEQLFGEIIIYPDFIQLHYYIYTLTYMLSLQILNALTSEILEHQGTFRTPSDQIQFIAQTLKDSECVYEMSV